MSDVPFPTPEESNSRRVLRGFVAMTASSFAVLGVQLGYAAITSRLLSPSAFGVYAVSLSGVGFIGMLGGSSLGQAASRRDHDSVHLDRSLVALALIVGCATALLAVLLAPLWGRLWGVPESVLVTRVLALGIPLTGLASVLAGILRRRGRTSTVAGRSAIGQLAGMAIGLATILSVKTAWSLGVAAVTGAVISGALLAASLPRERLVPTRPTRASVDDAIYGAKSAGMNLLRSGTNLIAPWSIGRFAGASGLGAYNRATTLLTLPLEAVQRAYSYSLFPELRPGGPASRSSNALTDIVILAAWPALFVGGIGYFAAPPFIALLLGPGWETAESIAGLALLLGVLPMVGVPLGSSLEAIGRFKVVATGWFLSAASIAAGAIGAARSGSPSPAVLGLLGASACASIFYAVVLARAGTLSTSRVLGATKLILGVQATVTVVLAVTTPRVPGGDLMLLAWIALVGALELSILWAIRRRTAFWQVGRSHRLPGFR